MNWFKPLTKTRGRVKPLAESAALYLHAQKRGYAILECFL
jgi:hypothetical protein